jgi:hypothetical protein
VIEIMPHKMRLTYLARSLAASARRTGSLSAGSV